MNDVREALAALDAYRASGSADAYYRARKHLVAVLEAGDCPHETVTPRADNRSWYTDDDGLAYGFGHREESSN